MNKENFNVVRLYLFILFLAIIFIIAALSQTVLETVISVILLVIAFIGTLVSIAAFYEDGN